MNKVILLGRLTKDVELRTTQTGTTVGSFSLAVDRRFQRQGEEKQTDFFNIVTFGKLAEFASKYFSKGKLCAIVGSIQNRTWVDKDGIKRYATDVIAEEINFAGSKNDSSSESAKPNTDNDSFMPIDDNEGLPF